MKNYLDINRNHPCFSPGAAHKQARIHLPVAKRCNISCNYCNRKYDCLNESRPGVASEIISPREGLERFQHYRKHLPHLSVVGIAGPGDALADWEESRQTMSLIRQYDPRVILCLSTNGLKLPKLAAGILALEVSHVTVTVNTLNPETGAKIYRYVNYEGKRYYDREGARILLENQLSGIRFLTQNGVIVKINTVMIPGINDQEIPDLVRQMKELGVYISNIMPLIPVPGSLFENMNPTDPRELSMMRHSCQNDLRQMFHCQQCRADAVGLLNSRPGCAKAGQQAG
jgi:nitrogen fixation protein NifB